MRAPPVGCGQRFKPAQHHTQTQCAGQMRKRHIRDVVRRKGLPPRVPRRLPAHTHSRKPARQLTQASDVGLDELRWDGALADFDEVSGKRSSLQAARLRSAHGVEIVHHELATAGATYPLDQTRVLRFPTAYLPARRRDLLRRPLGEVLLVSARFRARCDGWPAWSHLPGCACGAAH